MTILTLLTDFGEKDGYIGVLKGVIWSIAPHVQIADLTHEVEPQNIRQGALVLAQAAPFFPDGTIHVAVIDPGVGTTRRPIALRTGNQFFVGPDNGIFSWVLKQSENRVSTFEAVALDNPAYWLPLISRSFHGRDIFAPVAAHIANGRLLSELGTPIYDLVQIPFPMPVRTSDGWLGEIISIDHFGNLITNLQEHHIKSKERATLILGDFTINGISETFGSNTLGDLMAMIDSSGQLSVAVARGNAAYRTKAKVGDPVQLLDSASKTNRPH